MKKLAQTLTFSMISQLSKVELRMSVKTTITSAITSSNRGYLQRLLNLPAELLETALPAHKGQQSSRMRIRK